MMDRLRLVMALLVILPATFTAIPIQYLAVRFRSKSASVIPVYWHRMILRLMGCRIVVHGTVNADRPLLLVANHVSWFDIPVLGAVMPLCFIAKREVNEMPIANLLARLQRTVFVHREDRRGSAEQAKEIAGRLQMGDIMVLFAEGTTGDGHRVRDFKSSLFGAAQYALNGSGTSSAWVQPVSIAYTRLHGMPLGRFHQSQTSWPGNVPLGHHAKNLLTRGAYDIEVSFGEPIEILPGFKRREIAEQTRREVRTLFLDSIRQRHISNKVAE